MEAFDNGSPPLVGLTFVYINIVRQSVIPTWEVVNQASITINEDISLGVSFYQLRAVVSFYKSAYLGLIYTVMSSLLLNHLFSICSLC